VISALLLAATNPPASNVATGDIAHAFEQQSVRGEFDAMLRNGIEGFLEFRTVNNLSDASPDVVRQRAAGCVALPPDKDVPVQTAAGEIVARVRFRCPPTPNADPCEGNLASIALVRSEGSFVAFLVPERGEEASICPEHFQQIERDPNAAHLKTSNAIIDAFFEDLRLGRVSEAANHIGRIQSLSGLRPQFIDGSSYVAKVQTCEPSQADRVGIGYRIAWKCPDGDFSQVIISEDRQAKLVVTEMMRKGYVPKIAPVSPPTRQPERG
jgi:hypothetical protein